MNVSSVDWREELGAKCIQSVTNQNVQPDDNCSESEDNEEDAMEINSKSAVNSGKALAMLENLQIFFEENDAYDEFLWSVTSLMKRVKKWEYNLKSKKMSLIFSSNLFCSYEYKPKKYWKRKINHLKEFYLQSMSSLSSFLTKIEIRLSYRKNSTMMFLSIKKSFLSHRITTERLLCVILGFAEILTSFWSNLYKADTCLYGHIGSVP